MAPLKGHQVTGRVVWFAIYPAAMKDPDPLESQSARRRMMGAAAFAVAPRLARDTSPEPGTTAEPDSVTPASRRTTMSRAEELTAAVEGLEGGPSGGSPDESPHRERQGTGV